MATNGKHIAKPNPDANRKKIQASANLLAFLASVSLMAGIIISKGDGTSGSTPAGIEDSVDNEYDIETRLKAIISSTTTNQNNSNRYNTLGFIYHYFLDIINNQNLTNDEKKEIIKNALEDKEIYSKIYEYIENSSEKAKEFEHVNINANAINTIMTNQELMHDIHDASIAYHVPEAILVGLIARCINTNEYTNDIIYHAYNSEWNKLDSNRSSHNYVTGMDDQLKDWNSSNNIMHLAAILENAIKEENGDLFLAIQTVLAGPKKMSEIERELYNNVQSENYFKYMELANEVLSYAATYLNDERFTLEYSSVVEDKIYTSTFESSNYVDYLNNLINYAISIIDTELLSNARK